MDYKVAVLGSTGAVGEELLNLLEQRNFPVKSIKLLASERSVGKKLLFKAQEVSVQKLDHDSFEDVDIALFSAGASRSREFAPSAVKAGAMVIDNSSAFRMDPETPLVVPEVNPDDAKKHKGIIANPNCSTIQMVVVLKPIYDKAGIKRVVVSTYQSVSGSGLKAIQELQEQSKDLLDNRNIQRNVFPHQIAFNCIPQIPNSNAFMDNGYSEEEMKMVNETRKILGDDSIQVTATTVRVPVLYAHSEAVNIETNQKITADQVREILRTAPGVKVQDNLANEQYPLAINAEGKDDTFVGRIREDISIENGIDLWIVSDNLRKGAALNAIQIAELFI